MTVVHRVIERQILKRVNDVAIKRAYLRYFFFFSLHCSLNTLYTRPDPSVLIGKGPRRRFIKASPPSPDFMAILLREEKVVDYSEILFTRTVKPDWRRREKKKITQRDIAWLPPFF